MNNTQFISRRNTLKYLKECKIIIHRYKGNMLCLKKTLENIELGKHLSRIDFFVTDDNENYIKVAVHDWSVLGGAVFQYIIEKNPNKNNNSLLKNFKIKNTNEER